MRFSLRWLFGLVAFVAVACLSLIYATAAISNILSVVFFAFLMASVLGAIHASRQRRRFWFGCALVGLCYVASGYLLPRLFPMPWFATNAALDYLHPKIVRKVASATLDAPVFGTRPATFYLESPLAKDFRTAGQVLAAFIWSVAGGIIAGWFRRDEQRQHGGPVT
jgi:hypothetical protein